MSSAAGGSLSETHVKRGDRVVHGDKEFSERLAETIHARAARGALSSAAV